MATNSKEQWGPWISPMQKPETGEYVQLELQGHGETYLHECLVLGFFGEGIKTLVKAMPPFPKDTRGVLRWRRRIETTGIEVERTIRRKAPLARNTKERAVRTPCHT
ncbi:MAG: hypothetical protein CMP20_04075 [Rickettsiales bacterium]|nr:hypothetical protein [Rickettsiales bacterium]